MVGLRGHGERDRYGSVFAQLSPGQLKTRLLVIEMVRLVDRGVTHHSGSDLNPLCYRCLSSSLKAAYFDHLELVLAVAVNTSCKHLTGISIPNKSITLVNYQLLIYTSGK